MNRSLIGHGHLGHAVTDIVGDIEVSEGRGKNAKLAEKSDVLLLTVQPKELAALLKEIRGKIKDTATIMSFVGAIPKEWIERATGVKVVRGMTDISFREILSTDDLGILHELSSNVRLTEDERDIDRYTCLMGCLPGVAAHQFKYNSDAGIWLADYTNFIEDKIGTSRNISGGVINRVREDGDFEGMIEKVKTPGGFTDAMLAALAENPGLSFDELLRKGMLRADQIIEALSKDFDL